MAAYVVAASPTYSDFAEISYEHPPKIVDAQLKEANMSSLSHLTRLEVLGPERSSCHCTYHRHAC